MSKQFDIKNGILNLIKNPEDKEIAVDLFLEAIESNYEEFEYENDETPEQYLFGE